MPSSLALPESLLLSFLLVLARVSGAFVFVPIPGVNQVPAVARAALSICFTLALFPRWPAVDATSLTVLRLAGWAAAEASFGIALGIAVAVVMEAFGFAAQVLGVQAGFGFASTIDPNTEADSGILLVLAQLIASLLFFALGFDRRMLLVFAQSLERIPPGSFFLPATAIPGIIQIASVLFSAGVRLALPVTALLLMIDFALALLGRLNAQLQLISLAFPIKILTGLAMLAWVAPLFPRILNQVGLETLNAARRILGL
jgi:flagellar biosynthetic protein FliR